MDLVDNTGCLLNIGFPRLAGGTGGYVRYVAICPKEWKYGTSIDITKEAPLPKLACPLEWNEDLGYRARACNKSKHDWLKKRKGIYIFLKIANLLYYSKIRILLSCTNWLSKHKVYYIYNVQNLEKYILAIGL